MSLAKHAARGAATTLVGQTARFVIQVASVSILSRLIAPHDFGLFAMVTAIAGIAGIVADFGLSAASIQSQTLTDAQRSNLFWSNVGIGVIAALGIYLLSWPIAAFYNEPADVQITQVMAWVFLISAAGTQFRAEATARLRFSALAVVDVSAQAISLGAAAGIAVGGGGYWALVVQQLVLSSVTLIGVIVASGWRPGLPRRNAEMRALYSFGGHTFLIQAINYLTGNVDNVLVGRFSGAAALGVYSRSYQLFRLPLQQIAAPMTSVALPILSKLQASPQYMPYLLRAQLVLCYAFTGMFVGLAALSDPIVEILLGSGWDDVKPILAILAVGGVFQGIGYTYYWIFLSKAMTNLQLRFSLVGRGVMIVLMVAGVVWGPIGVAVGSTVGQFGVWLLNTVFAVPRTGVDVKPLLRIAVRPFLLFATVGSTAYGVSLVLRDLFSPWFVLGVELGIVLMGCAVAFFLVAAGRADARELWDVVRRLRR